MASFGENLRRERELRGIELRDIAEATKISVRFLQALEQDRVDILPGGIFRRAFVRQYARHVGLDPERLVAEFVYAHGEKEVPEAPPQRGARRTPPRGWIIVAAVLLAGGLFALARTGPRPAKEALAGPPPPAAAVAADRVYPPPGSQVDQASASTDNLVLTLSARESCWVAAQVDGQTVLNRVMNEGETETIEATGAIILSVGNAGGLSFRVNDRAGVPLGRSGEVRRNIVITRKSLPSLVEEAPTVRTSHSS